MASFDLTAQLQLQAPTNTNAVIGQIKNQLKGLNVPVNVQANTQAIKQTTQAVNNVSKSSKDASKSVDKLGNSIKYAARRFGAFAVGTQILGGISSGFAKVTKEAIAFEKELNKIRQITGKTEGQLARLNSTITDLSRSLGVSSNELLGVAKTLSQAGFAARDVEKSLRVLAQTTLGSSFNTIAETTEGAIAILRQFDRQAQATGDASKFLEQSLDAVNAVSKRFAVESSDIIQAVRRVGGVFSAAGGEVNELIALFTSIRATTRESAETIAVGLRTIFSRLQRVDTIEKLQGLGIQLQDLNGQFVGPLKAIEQLAGALGSIDPKDFRVSEIVEELGGIRQVGKVIPLIYQYATAQQALEVANASSGSIAKDAALAQLTLANQFAKTGEAFADLARKFTQSKGFKDFASQMLQIANAVAKVAESLIPLIPLVTQLGAAFAGIKLAGFVTKGVGSILGKNSGGKIHKFARGGFVPGTGNSDTVPAMLQPGEFVIKKSSAQKLGADTLNRMNNNRFKDGTPDGVQQDIVLPKQKARGAGISAFGKATGASAVLKAVGDNDPADGDFEIGGAFLNPDNVTRRLVANFDSAGNLYKDVTANLGKFQDRSANNVTTNAKLREIIGDVGKKINIDITSGSLSANKSTEFSNGLKSSISGFSERFASGIGLGFDSAKFATAYSSANPEQVEGNLFEATLAGMSNAPFDNARINANDPIDFRKGLGNAAAAFGLPEDLPTDAKRTFGKESLESLTKKGYNTLVEGLRITLSQALLDGPGSSETKAKRQAEVDQAAARGISGIQRRNLGGIIQKFEEGGEAASEKQVAFVNSLLDQFQRDVGQRHPATDEWIPLDSKAAASSIITKLKAAQKETSLLKQFLGNGVSYGYGGGRSGSGFVVRKSGPGRAQQRALSEFGGDKKKIQEYIERGELAFGSNAPSSRAPAATSATSRLRTRYGYGGRRRYAAGGSAGTDTVPALLTPGEYVINKSAAQSIGYKNLNSMNETGVAKFATGGAVGVQRFASGGAADNPFANMGGTMGVAAKKSADALSKSLDDLSDKADDTSKSFDSFKKSKDTLNKFAGGLQKASFGFALAASTVLQFTKSTLGLSDEQAVAAQETIGFATIIAGAIGTLISWVTSINTATAAEATDTAATNTHAAAVASDTAAIKGKTAADLLQTKQTSGGFKGLLKSIDPLTAILAVATVAFTTVVSVLKYNASILRQQADKSKKAFEDFIENVRSGEQGAGNAGELAKAEATANARSQAANSATTVGAVGAGAAILTGVGLFLAGVFAPVTAIVVVVVGAITALAAAFGFLSFKTAEYEQEIQNNINELKLFAEATAIAAEVQANISKGLETINENAAAALPQNATEEQRQAVEQRRVAQSVGLVTSEASRLDTSVTTSAFGTLEKIAKKLDKPVSQLTEQDITTDKEASTFFGGPKLSPIEATTAINAIRAVAEQKSAIDAALQSSRQLLGDAAALEIDGTQTFQQLINSGGAFAQALKQTETLIRQQSELRIAELKSQRADLAAQGNQQGVANIDAQIKAEEEGRQRSIDGLRNSYEASANFAIENRKAAEAEAAFRSAMVRTIKQFELMDSVLITVENSLNRISEASQNYVAALTDGQIKFGNTLPENFGDITNTGDPGQFQAELDAALKPFGAVGQKLKSQITSGANILETARQGLGNIEFKIGEEVNATELLDRLNLNKANLGEEVFNKISNDLRKAAKDGGTLTEEQIQEIFAPALEESKRAAEQAKRLNEVRNRNLEIYSNYVDNMKTQFERELSARQKVIDVELQNAEILAAAGVRGEVSRREREQSRTQRAQIGLTGTGLAAGDIQGAADLIAQSVAERQKIAARQEAGIAGPQDVRNLAKFNTQIGQATAELERLADQSDRVADIQADIEKERAKRGAIEDIAGDFVFGGQSARESINAGLAGVQAAFQTGTVQNQSEEQRQATLQTLDRLQSIPFFRDLKQNLIKADAARLGIDPAIADALFNPTTEEQRLQKELIAVTQQRTNASMALAQLEAQKTQDLINSEQQLINALGRVEAAILNQDPAQGRVGRATGGIVRGPGTSRSDSIPARLSNGEYVVNAQATKKYGGLLENINNGKPLYAAGGSLVSAAITAGKEMAATSASGVLGSVSDATGVTSNMTGTLVGLGGDAAVTAGFQVANATRAATTAGQVLTTGAKVAAGTAGAVSAYGGYTLSDAAVQAWKYGADWEGTVDENAAHNRRQAGQGWLQNAGENAANPGRTGAQLIQETVGLSEDSQTAALAENKTARMQDNAAVIPPGQQEEYARRKAREKVNAALANLDYAGAFAKGGTVFKPKGVDTVPAMLQPGEFVMSRKGVDANGVDIMEHMNSGGKVMYASRGGGVRVRSRNRQRAPNIRSIYSSSYGAAGPGVQGGVAGQAVGRGRSGSLPRDDRPSAGGGNDGIGGGAAGAGGRASQNNRGYAARPDTTPRQSTGPQAYTDEGLTPFPYARVSQQVRENQAAQMGRPGEFSAAMASSAPTSDQDVFVLRPDEQLQFGGSGFVPTYVQPVENKPLPTTSVADHPVRGKGSGYYARQVASESIRSRREQRQSGTPTNAYDMQRQQNLQAYQTRQSERARMFGGDSAEARMNRAQLGRMQAQQMQNKYNARAANFNSSIEQSQMAFRQQAAQFVGPSALQGAGGGMLTGGGGYMAGGGGYGGGQMGQQQTNNMVAAANNNGGGMQSMNGMTINHNVTVSGMISVGGLNIQAVASAVTQSVGQMVANEVSRQMKSMNQGFRTGT